MRGILAAVALGCVDVGAGLDLKVSQFPTWGAQRPAKQSISKYQMQAMIDAEPVLSATAQCNPEEYRRLRPLVKLDLRILGEASSQHTVKPKRTDELPEECQAAMMQHDWSRKPRIQASEFMPCYQTLTKHSSVAMCYANDEAHKRNACRSKCQGMDAWGVSCLECKQSKGWDKFACINRAMNISMPCQSCRGRAFDFHNTRCAVLCVTVFDIDSLSCRKCNDIHDEMQNSCFSA